ncbi:MAG: RNA polymerase alpha subunit C-terminal domain-containing protein [Fluviicola sp.]
MEKTCENGHTFFKTSDCPTCPTCENERKPTDSFLSKLGAPARRALERENILSLEELSKWTEKELIQLHGIGPSSIPILEKALNEMGLTFKSISK